jgi:hydrogenase maturation protease
VDIRVLGLGNVLMGDDGLGPHVIEALAAAYDCPPDVSLIDVGTPGLDLAPFLIGADAVIVVDAVRANDAPGTVRTYDRAALLRHAPAQRLGPHDPGFKQTLLTLDFAGLGPREVTLVGMVPHATAPCARLSPAVRASLPRAVEAVVCALQRVGVQVRPRADARAAAPWWEAVPAERRT